MDGQPHERYPREGKLLGEHPAPQGTGGVAYSNTTPLRQRLIWRLRDLLRRPVRNTPRR